MTKKQKLEITKMILPVALLLVFVFGIFQYFNMSRPLVIKFDGLPEAEAEALAKMIRQDYSIPETVKPGIRTTLPEIEYKDFTFNKWKDSEGNVISSVAWQISNKSEVEIHAVFDPKYYKILYTDGNENVIKEEPYAYGVGEQIEDGSILRNTNGFIGWADGTGQIITEISGKTKGDVRLHPVFQGDDYKSPEIKETLSENKDYIQIGEYFAYLYDGTDQAITDAENSANIFSYNGKEVITDHRSQGIDEVMTNSKATLFRNGETRELRCVHRKQGYNKENELVLLNGTDAFKEYDDYSVLIYTCNDIDGVSISITYWKELMSTTTSITR